MKKLLALTLALALTLTTLVIPAMAENEGTGYYGMLSLLNTKEEKFSEVGSSGSVTSIPKAEQTARSSTGNLVPKFFDTLDAMLMALSSGEVTTISLPLSTANYLCANNDSVTKLFQDGIPTDGILGMFIDILSYGYSFMMLEQNTALRDDFDRVLAEMKEDGTLAALQKAYIDDAIGGTKPEAVAFEKTDGKTVTVAVTGCLPPMDYVAEDGTPAGFNTAILAEIGRRLGVNIELIQVDSVGRAMALSSGVADVAFWTQGVSSKIAGMTEEEYNAYIEAQTEGLPQELKELILSAIFAMSYEELIRQDLPDGTICTKPYYDDIATTVILK